MKYRGFTNNVKKYINKYFCKYGSKTKFSKIEYCTFKRRIYTEWYFDEDISFEDIYKREFINDWVNRSRLNLIHMGYVLNGKQATGEKLFTGFKPNHAIVIGAVRDNHQSTIKQLPILFKGGQ